MSSTSIPEQSHWIVELMASWREEAKLFQRRGAKSQAAALRSCADDLEGGFLDWQIEELTLEDASRESGYSYSTLQQKVACGEVANSGAKGRPRIRRCDLPRHGRSCHGAEDGEPLLAGLVLANRQGCGT